MNEFPAPSARRLWGWLAGLTLVVALPIGLVLGGAVWTVRSTLGAGRETLALRDALLAGDDAWAPQVQGRLGWPLLAAARLAAGCASAPPEARLALGAVRSADVAVLQLRPGRAMPALAAMAPRACAAAGPGWVPAVTVRTRGEAVLVLIRDDESGQTLACRVLVLAEGRLVIASAELSIEDLVRLADRLGA